MSTQPSSSRFEKPVEEEQKYDPVHHTNDSYPPSAASDHLPHKKSPPPTAPPAPKDPNQHPSTPPRPSPDLKTPSKSQWQQFLPTSSSPPVPGRPANHPTDVPPPSSVPTIQSTLDTSQHDRNLLEAGISPTAPKLPPRTSPTPSSSSRTTGPTALHASSSTTHPSPPPQFQHQYSVPSINTSSHASDADKYHHRMDSLVDVDMSGPVNKLDYNKIRSHNIDLLERELQASRDQAQGQSAHSQQPTDHASTPGAVSASMINTTSSVPSSQAASVQPHTRPHETTHVTSSSSHPAPAPAPIVTRAPTADHISRPQSQLMAAAPPPPSHLAAAFTANHPTSDSTHRTHDDVAVDVATIKPTTTTTTLPTPAPPPNHLEHFSGTDGNLRTENGSLIIGYHPNGAPVVMLDSGGKFSSASTAISHSQQVYYPIILLAIVAATLIMGFVPQWNTSEWRKYRSLQPLLLTAAGLLACFLFLSIIHSLMLLISGRSLWHNHQKLRTHKNVLFYTTSLALTALASVFVLTSILIMVFNFNHFHKNTTMLGAVTWWASMCVGAPLLVYMLFRTILDLIQVWRRPPAAPSVPKEPVYNTNAQMATPVVQQVNKKNSQNNTDHLSVSQPHSHSPFPSQRDEYHSSSTHHTPHSRSAYDSTRVHDNLNPPPPAYAYD